jgi:hypothetical protein
MSGDVPAFYEHLRASTIALLGYNDASPLSAAQQIRVDRAVSLRLIVDASQAKQLRGEPVNVREFTDASESLEHMCGGNPDGAADRHDFSGARRELELFLNARAEKIAHRDARLAAAEAERMADIYRRKEMAAVLAAAPDFRQMHVPHGSIQLTIRQRTRVLQEWPPR